MKIKLTLLSILIFIFIPLNTFASTNHIIDKANVMNDETILSANNTLSALENTTQTKMEVLIVPSLNGRNIMDVGVEEAKTLNTDKSAVFVLSIADRTNKLIIGSGLNNDFNKDDLNVINKLPHDSFASGDYNGGISKVVGEVDRHIMSKEMPEGNPEPVQEQSTTSMPSDSAVILAVVIVAIGCIILIIKNKRDRKRREALAKEKEQLRLLEEQKAKELELEKIARRERESKQRIDNYNSEYNYSNYNRKKPSPPSSWSPSLANNRQTTPVNKTQSTNTSSKNVQPTKVIVNNTTHVRSSNSHSDYGTGFVHGVIADEIIHHVHESPSYESHHHNDYSCSDDNSYSDNSSFTASDDSNW